jgi:hypothetical protein
VTKRKGMNGVKGGLAAKPRVIREMEMELPVKLTDAEKIAKGEALARVLSDIQAEESRADMVKQALKSIMTALEAEQDRLLVIVQRGEELRVTKVQDEADDKALLVRRVRLDTGEIMTERAMTPEEKQVPIPGLEIVPKGDGDGRGA